MAREMGLSGKTRSVRKCPRGLNSKVRWKSQGAPGGEDSASQAVDVPGPVGLAGEGEGEAFADSFRSNSACAVAAPRPPHRNVPEAGTSLNEKPQCTLHDKSALKAYFVPGRFQHSSSIRHFLLATLNSSEEPALEMRDLLKVTVNSNPDPLSLKPLSPFPGCSSWLDEAVMSINTRERNSREKHRSRPSGGEMFAQVSPPVSKYVTLPAPRGESS